MDNKGSSVRGHLEQEEITYLSLNKRLIIEKKLNL